MLDGSVLKEARVKKKWTQCQLAKKARVSNVTISLLERNMRPNARYSTIDRVYGALQLKDKGGVHIDTGSKSID